jgi:small subunit ribosomal protein S2
MSYRPELSLEKFSYNQLMWYGVHIGHSFLTSLFYTSWLIYSYTSNILILNLFKTLQGMRSGLSSIIGAVSSYSPIWFINLDQSAGIPVRYLAGSCGEFSVTSFWINGFISNYVSVYNTYRKLKKISWFAHPAKNKNAVDIYKIWYLTRNTWPRTVFISNVNSSYQPAKETISLGIPCIGIVDSNTYTHVVSIALPGNDDSVECLVFYNEFISKFILLKKFSLILLWFFNIRKNKRLLAFKDWIKHKENHSAKLSSKTVDLKFNFSFFRNINLGMKILFSSNSKYNVDVFECLDIIHLDKLNMPRNLESIEDILDRKNKMFGMLNNYTLYINNIKNYYFGKRLWTAYKIMKRFFFQPRYFKLNLFSNNYFKTNIKIDRFYRTHLRWHFFKKMSMVRSLKFFMIYNFSKYKQLHIKSIYTNDLLGRVYYKFVLGNLFTNKKYFDLKINGDIRFKPHLNFFHFNHFYIRKKRSVMKKIYSFLNVINWFRFSVRNRRLFLKRMKFIKYFSFMCNENTFNNFKYYNRFKFFKKRYTTLISRILKSKILIFIQNTITRRLLILLYNRFSDNLVYKANSILLKRRLKRLLMKCYIYINTDSSNNIYIKFFRSKKHRNICLYFGRSFYLYIYKNINILLDGINKKNMNWNFNNIHNIRLIFNKVLKLNYIKLKSKINKLYFDENSLKKVLNQMNLNKLHIKYGKKNMTMNKRYKNSNHQINMPLLKDNINSINKLISSVIDKYTKIQINIERDVTTKDRSIDKENFRKSYSDIMKYRFYRVRNVMKKNIMRRKRTKFKNILYFIFSSDKKLYKKWRKECDDFFKKNTRLKHIFWSLGQMQFLYNRILNWYWRISFHKTQARNLTAKKHRRKYSLLLSFFVMNFHDSHAKKELLYHFLQSSFFKSKYYFSLNFSNKFLLLLMLKIVFNKIPDFSLYENLIQYVKDINTVYSNRMRSPSFFNIIKYEYISYIKLNPFYINTYDYWNYIKYENFILWKKNNFLNNINWRLFHKYKIMKKNIFFFDLFSRYKHLYNNYERNHKSIYTSNIKYSLGWFEFDRSINTKYWFYQKEFFSFPSWFYNYKKILFRKWFPYSKRLYKPTYINKFKRVLYTLPFLSSNKKKILLNYFKIKYDNLLPRSIKFFLLNELILYLDKYSSIKLKNRIRSYSKYFRTIKIKPRKYKPYKKNKKDKYIYFNKKHISGNLNRRFHRAISSDEQYTLFMKKINNELYSWRDTKRILNNKIKDLYDSDVARYKNLKNFLFYMEFLLKYKKYDLLFKLLSIFNLSPSSKIIIYMIKRILHKKNFYNFFNRVYKMKCININNISSPINNFIFKFLNVRNFNSFHDIKIFLKAFKILLFKRNTYRSMSKPLLRFKRFNKRPKSTRRYKHNVFHDKNNKVLDTFMRRAVKKNNLFLVNKNKLSLIDLKKFIKMYGIAWI